MTAAKETAESAGNWEKFRSQMPITEQWAYLDHAAVAPMSGPAQQWMTLWAEDATVNGSANYTTWARRVDDLRAQTAHLLGAETEEIAFVENTTAGINLVAEGFPWQPGDNVVTRADEFPANQYPWLHLASRGVETRRVPSKDGRLELDCLLDACDSRTRIVTVSWIAFASGWRHELDRLVEMVHRRGAYLFLDAIQGLGVFPLDVQQTPVDFLSADGHKWLLGPEGAGVFYTRREHLSLLKPVRVGWNSVRNAMDFSNIDFILKDTAERYEGGSANMAGLVALGASVDLLRQFGTAALSQRVLELSDLACQRLEAVGAVILSNRSETHKSGIVSFQMPGRDPNELRRQCFAQKVLLSCRAGRLRISPHAYNNTDDIERLIDVLRRP